MVIEFRDIESDAWFDRTLQYSHFFDETWPQNDPISLNISRLPSIQNTSSLNVLEIGCGRAVRLKKLKEKYNFNVFGIDISKKSVEEAIRNGVDAIISQSTNLPYNDQYFDIVIVGFCLYMHRLDELFKVFSECDRVLKSQSYLLIQDFYSKYPIDVPYGHQKNSTIMKYQYIDAFLWHPSYSLFSHQLLDHDNLKPTDLVSNLVSVSTLRKNQSSAFHYSSSSYQ